MLEDIAPFAGLIKALGYGGIAIFVVYSIIRGWLVPARTVEKLLADKDKQIENLWEAHKSNSASLEQLSLQVQHMTNNAELSVMLLGALRTLGDENRERVVLGEIRANQTPMAEEGR